MSGNLEPIDLTRVPDMDAPDGSTHVLFDSSGASFWRIDEDGIYKSNGGSWIEMQIVSASAEKGESE
jgi:hypothetical protein